MRRSRFASTELCRCSSQSSACSESQKYQSSGPSRSLNRSCIAARLQHQRHHERVKRRQGRSLTKMAIWMKCSLFPEWKFPNVVLKMSRVPSLKDLAFSAIPSRVPSLKQLARAAVAANRPPLPAHTLARRQYDHKVDVTPRLIRRLWDAIFEAVARTTNFGNDVLTLLTPHLELWRREGDWKIFDIPRPPSIRLRGNEGDNDIRPSEDRVGSYVEVQRKEVPVDGKRRPSPFLGAW